MSNKIRKKVRDALIGNPTAKELLFQMADQSNDMGYGVWSSIRYYEHCLERGRSTIKNSQKYLVKEGFITNAGRGPNGTNRWQISLPALDKVRRVYHKCEVCGEYEGLVNDHWIPRSKGGTDDEWNIVRLCGGCNLEKTDRDPEEWLSDRTDVLLRIQKRLNSIRGVVADRQGGSEQTSKGVQSGPQSTKEAQIEQKEFYDALRKGWALSFPNKEGQTKKEWADLAETKKSNVRARFKEKEFVENWKAVMWNARTNSHLKNSKWFTIWYFIRNAYNWEKVRDGVFDSFDEERTPKENKTAPRQGTVIINRRPGLVKYDK